ncbi:MAG TPA: hypothetical protein VMW75_26600 [Thermoanaerobaculia bacterium]|nr:hypothetical protein [Thermoanaerobaculia bacterium]
MEREAEGSATGLNQEMRWRFRACSYLFNLGGIWFFVGTMLNLLLRFLPSRAVHEESFIFAFVITFIGFGIFSAAFALSRAIYRCPVCDKPLARIDRYNCGRCGTKIRDLPASK